MPNLRSMPEEGNFLDILRGHSGVMFPLLDFEQALLRGPSPFSEAERELLVAFVSGVNACSYCQRSHTFVAAEYEVAEELPAALLEDIEGAAVDEKLKPVFHFARKLTETPARITAADTAPLYDAGWDDTAVFHTIAVTSYTNLVNRLVDGIGLEAPDEPLREIAKALKAGGYTGVKDFVAAEGDGAS